MRLPPTPIPKTSRPPETMSTVAAILASRVGRPEPVVGHHHPEPQPGGLSRQGGEQRPGLQGGPAHVAAQGHHVVPQPGVLEERGCGRRRARCAQGKTPILQYSFTWNQLSAVAGVTFWNIYFKLVNGAVRAPELVAFLKNLRRHLRGRKLLIIWDRLQAHRSRLVRDYVDTEGGDIQLEFLPPYAPELNPVEYLWAHWKRRQMPNFCPKDFAELSAFARAKLKRTQRRKLVVAAFWKQADLPF